MDRTVHLGHHTREYGSYGAYMAQHTRIYGPYGPYLAQHIPENMNSAVHIWLNIQENGRGFGNQKPCRQNRKL